MYVYTMIKHSLVCLLKDDKNASFKTVRASSSPTLEKVREIYYKNVEVLQYILTYCHENSIKSLRVSSSLFPLCTYLPYREMLAPLLDEVGKEYAKVNYYDIELSAHPDQFILLSSLNPGINANSRYELDVYAKMRQYIPWDLINIHGGSKAQGFDIHGAILKEQVKLLSQDVRQILSLENDEKSYSFLETLQLAEENKLMIVPDFHHERCFQKHKENNGESLSVDDHAQWNKTIDQVIYDNMDRVLATYENKSANPTFHISSPISGWNGNFKDHCKHADYISSDDYPHYLHEIAKEKNVTIRLDVEAKAKNEAIFALANSLTV